MKQFEVKNRKFSKAQGSRGIFQNIQQVGLS